MKDNNVNSLLISQIYVFSIMIRAFKTTGANSFSHLQVQNLTSESIFTRGPYIIPNMFAITIAIRIWTCSYFFLGWGGHIFFANFCQSPELLPENAIPSGGGDFCPFSPLPAL